jgi:uncharacterized protein
VIYLLLLLVIAPIAVSLFARGKFQAVYEESMEVECRPTLTGAGVARKILEASGIEDVEIVEHWGLFPDFYDPARKRLALSRPHFRGSNAAAYGIAAHEAGHALQDKAKFAPLKRRLSAIKSTQYLSPLIFLLGASALIARIVPVKIAILIMVAAWTALLVSNIFTMPVEADATQRAKEVLGRLRIFRDAAEEKATLRMAKAAGLMYISGFLNTLKWLFVRLRS